MWNRLIHHRLVSSIQVFKRLQSVGQYYPINDDVYGFSDDQKQVFCIEFYVHSEVIFEMNSSEKRYLHLFKRN